MTLRNIPRTALVALVAIAATSCRSPMADAQMTEQMRQLADELNGTRQDMAGIRDEIDSLRTVAAKQDTIIRQLANSAGVPLPVR